MPAISPATDIQTVISTFETSPGHCATLLEALKAAYDEVISHQPGFLAAALHVNDAQTRIANYSQWRKREDFLAMLRTDEMQRRNAEMLKLCRSFEPVLYEVADVHGDWRGA